MRKILILGFLAIVASFLVTSCSKEELSTKSEILSFIFESSKNNQLERNYQGFIDEHFINVNVPYTTDLTNLIPTIEISPRATINPSSGIATNFSNEFMYTVTAENKEISYFYVNVKKDVAPYVGKWSSSSFDYGCGLMKLNLEITAMGDISMEFINIMTGDKSNNSIKGTFNPQSKSDIDIMITQTYTWSTDEWISKEGAKTFMFHFNNLEYSSMTFYYCTEYPRTEWCFQINLSKQ